MGRAHQRRLVSVQVYKIIGSKVVGPGEHHNKRPTARLVALKKLVLIGQRFFDDVLERFYSTLNRGFVKNR